MVHAMALFDKPIAEWLKLQGRFRHLFKPENKPLLDDIQRITDKNWEELLKKEAASLKEWVVKTA